MAKPEAIRKVADSKFAKIALYGDPGVGKTRFIGSSPGRVLIVAPPTDHRDSMSPSDKSRVDEWIVNDWDEMNQVLDFARMEGHQYDWIWVDSLSLLQDHLLDDLWETTVAEKPARARYGLDKQEYGINFFRLGGWMRHMIGPDTFNFGFTAHTAQLLPSEDEEESVKLMPWVQGKNMSAKFCGYMNVVAFMEATKIGDKENRRVLRLTATERYYAKDQFDMSPDARVVDPTMEKVAGLIDASRARAKRATPTTKKPTRRVAKRS